MQGGTGAYFGFSKNVLICLYKLTHYFLHSNSNFLKVHNVQVHIKVCQPWANVLSNDGNQAFLSGAK